MTESQESEKVPPQPPISLDEVSGGECIKPAKRGPPENNAKWGTDKQSSAREEPLSKQMLYYFSTQNLSNDTYLKTMMELNSGYVPVSILSNFANITRIISSSLKADETIYNVDVPSLLRHAALRSEFLDVAVLNHQGEIIAEDKDGNYRLEAGRLNFFAIGPSSIRPKDADKVQPLRQDLKKTQKDKTNDSANIVILRDVAKDAVEEDIRAAFQSDSSFVITDIRRDIENFWFVSFDPSKSRQNTVDMLLSLRSKKIRGEPIKARLKSQRMASNDSSLVEAVATPSLGFNPYRAGGRSKSGAPTRGYSNQIYSGDRVYYGGKKNYSHGKGGGFPGSGSNKNPRASRGNGSSNSNESSTNKGGNNASKKNGKETDKVVPLPSCEKHFPSLGKNSPKSTILPSGTNAVNTGKEASVEDNVVEREDTNVPVTNVPDTISAKESYSSFGGYAAALLKAVPSTEVTSSMTRTAPSSTPISKKMVKKRAVHKSDSVQKSDPGISSSSTKSSGTATTDDASSDEKSISSSKPESEKSMTVGTPSAPTVVTTSVTASGWGGGRSFADIVKKQEITENIPVKN